jgi:hypothetical protein
MSRELPGVSSTKFKCLDLFFSDGKYLPEFHPDDRFNIAKQVTYWGRVRAFFPYGKRPEKMLTVSYASHLSPTYDRKFLSVPYHYLGINHFSELPETTIQFNERPITFFDQTGDRSWHVIKETVGAGAFGKAYEARTIRGGEPDSPVLLKRKFSSQDPQKDIRETRVANENYLSGTPGARETKKYGFTLARTDSCDDLSLISKMALVDADSRGRNLRDVCRNPGFNPDAEALFKYCHNIIENSRHYNEVLERFHFDGELDNMILSKSGGVVLIDHDHAKGLDDITTPPIRSRFITPEYFQYLANTKAKARGAGDELTGCQTMQELGSVTDRYLLGISLIRLLLKPEYINAVYPNGKVNIANASRGINTPYKRIHPDHLRGTLDFDTRVFLTRWFNDSFCTPGNPVRAPSYSEYAALIDAAKAISEQSDQSDFDASEAIAESPGPVVSEVIAENPHPSSPDSEYMDEGQDQVGSMGSADPSEYIDEDQVGSMGSVGPTMPDQGYRSSVRFSTGSSPADQGDLGRTPIDSMRRLSSRQAETLGPVSRGERSTSLATNPSALFTGRATVSQPDVVETAARRIRVSEV